MITILSFTTGIVTTFYLLHLGLDLIVDWGGRQL